MKLQQYRQEKMEDNNKMTYEGKPLPKWLQTPVYKKESQKKRDEIPEWLQEPVKLQ